MRKYIEVGKTLIINEEVFVCKKREKVIETCKLCSFNDRENPEETENCKAVSCMDWERPDRNNTYFKKKNP